MSDILSIGASGVRAYQRALSNVSANIGNAENPNYVRRDLRLSEMAITNGIDPYHNYQLSFGGVDTGGVARSSNPFLEANLRLTGSALRGAETAARWMSSVETALNDDDHGIGARLTSVFTSGEELAAAPFDSVLRNQFIANLDASANAFNRTARDLADVSDQIVSATEQDVRTFNEALHHLAETNIKLRGTADGSSQRATLLDQRDTALAVLTEHMDLTITFVDHGVANIATNGTELLEIGNVTPIALSINQDGTLGLLVDGLPTNAPSEGSLSGLISSAATNAQRQSELDQLANDFADAVNGWHANGETDSGMPGSPLISAGTGALSLNLLSQSPATLALAIPGGASNGNILNLSAVRSATGLESTWTNIVGAQAIVSASAQSETSAAGAQFQAARDARDNLSTVDLDREAADLIRFQQAYDASARVIQVARETMQSIFAIF